MTNGASQETQLAVIGAGPGGYAAAFHAAEHGLSTVLIDADPNLGGVCLNRGCIPSKALLHVAKLIVEAREAAAWGIGFGSPQIDLDRLRQWKEQVVQRLTGGIAQLAKRREVEVQTARASFLDAHTLKLEPTDGSPARNLRFEHAIVATGSSPVVPSILEVDDERVMDSTAALDLPSIPRRLLVVGGGYIGLEMGSVYAALGSRVTCVEMTPGLLPGVDRDLVRPLAGRLEEMFEDVRLETKVESLEPRDDGILATLRGQDGPPEEVMFDRVLVSVGRRPNTGNLGLETTGVRLDDQGFIGVDANRRTGESSILAIGDVAGEPLLAHKATREAKVAVESLVGEPAAFDNPAIPAVVFTDPEVAWCGLTETRARDEGIPCGVSKFPWGASGRALTLGRPEGLTKILYDPDTQRVLGMGVVGSGAGELIAEGVLAVEMAAVARDLAESVHAHPTLSETVMEAAEMVFGPATHVVRSRRRG